jgi:hypothetical protein
MAEQPVNTRLERDVADAAVGARRIVVEPG